MYWDALIADQERGALVIMTAQTISSSTIAGLSDPSVRPSTQELARCWLALARSDWLSTGGQPLANHGARALSVRGHVKPLR